MPHLPHLLAASDAGAIIWLIILVFWGFSTVMQKGREKKEAEKRRARQQYGSGSPAPAAAPPLPRREVASPEEELKRFLEEITGRKTAAAPPPPAAAPDPPRRVIVRKREPEPLIQFDAPPPDPAPAPAKPHNAYAQTSAEIGSIHEGDAYAPLGEIEDIEKLMDRQAAALYSGETMVRPDSMLVNLSKIRVPLMTLPLVSYKSVKHAVDRPALKGNRHALQQALIARVILGPCKAFGDDTASRGQPGS